jgi:AbrB family looped-hinge helix DNA binding protein
MHSLLKGVLVNAIAKITSKGQTTIPQEIRTAMQVGPGDLIVWELDKDGTARVRRVEPVDLPYLRALEGTVSEWAGEADEDAYRDL